MDEWREIAAGLSKPATRLVEKISDAVGVLYEPTYLRKIGGAKADVALLEAATKVKVTDIERRAIVRWRHEETMNQRNMEEILKKALPQISDDANPDVLDNDWVSNLFGKCRAVSDKEMQSLWSKVLAGEVNMPGSFSKRTVNALSDLDRLEAELFTCLGGFVCDFGGYIPVVLNLDDQIYTDSGINYGTVRYLDSAGLIDYGGITHTSITAQKGDAISYYGSFLIVEEPRNGSFGMDCGIVNFTTVGHELFPICGSKPIDGFLEYLRLKWDKHLS
ncbi:MAG: DUF2806 domain-containing protein [bacterium]|nr:DUF2806 domain-containing protein [bacterium]